jgi:hypothetical protein
MSKLKNATYKLYRGQTACDSDDWGRPRGKYPTLLEAMAAAGLPDPGAWQTDRHCPDEVFNDPRGLYWSILAPGVAQEAAALGAGDTS